MMASMDAAPQNLAKPQQKVRWYQVGAGLILLAAVLAAISLALF
jgi:hypothetical protein